MKQIYNKSKEEIFNELKTSQNGLSNEEVKIRLEQNGKNKLKEAKKQNIVQKFFSQFKDILIVILLVSAFVSLFLGELVDSIIIFVVVLINAIIGVIQENKAENAMENLKNLTKPFTKVIRNGVIEKILTEELTLGDIVVLEAGDFVPADLRIIDSSQLKIVESSLTGESNGVDKVSYMLSNENLALGDQINMAFMGTNVAYGRGTGVVVKIGDNTEMGKIAVNLAETKKSRTPLQKRVDKTSKVLSIIILSLSVIIFIVGLIRNPNNVIESFMVAIAIAVCAVPEGLPAGITVTMSIGVANMTKKKAIVKKLASVETLGSTQIICSDKTGTLTLNKMTVQEIFVNNMDKFENDKNPNFLKLIEAMLLCNDTKIKIEDDKLLTIGDPTETALVTFAQKYGFNKDELNGRYPRVNEIPFDSDRKLMTTINSVSKEKTFAYTKGAIDCLLEKCTHILDNGKERPITTEDKKNILRKNHELSMKALRILGYAYKKFNGDIYNINQKDVESELTFIGLSGMIDPPREEIFDSIKTCKEAGIRVIMITGDHKDTAFAIAKQIGIAEEPNEVMSGVEIDALNDEEFENALKTIKVFARVSPEHKVRVVKTLRKLDYVVAMTGDGVNDAPSLKQANIGIGMGITGTDVTKDVADIILTDDNFSTIVGAVEEGRRIYSNVLKIIVFLLCTCIAEVFLMFVVITILGLELFTPAVILWINIIGDTFPSLALGMEKSEKKIMKQKPNDNRSSLFSGANGFNIIGMGIFQGAYLLILFVISYYGFNLPIENVSSICFITLIFMELFHCYNLREAKESIFKSNPFKNKLLNYAVLTSIILTVGFILLLPNPALLDLGLMKPTLVQWIICILYASLIIPVYELVKLVIRKKGTKTKKQS